MRSREPRSLSRDAEFLADADEIGVLQDVLVRLEDLRVEARVAVVLLRDLGEGLALLDLVPLGVIGRPSRRGLRCVGHETSFFVRRPARPLGVRPSAKRFEPATYGPPPGLSRAAARLPSSFGEPQRAPPASLNGPRREASTGPAGKPQIAFRPRSRAASPRCSAAGSPPKARRKCAGAPKKLPGESAVPVSRKSFSTKGP